MTYTKRLGVALGILMVAALIGGLHVAYAATTLLDEDFASFDGSGFATSPAAGQLDSDVWRVTGLSDGDGTFGGTYTTGDFARGIGDTSTTVGGLYAMQLGVFPGTGLGFKPTLDDATPAEVTVRLPNTTGQYITSLRISLNASYTYTGAEGDMQIGRLFALDNEAVYQQGFVSELGPTSDVSVDGTDTLSAIDTYNLLAVPPGDDLHVKLTFEDATPGGGSSWGEIALDALTVTAHETATNSLVNGTFEQSPLGWDLISEDGTDQRFQANARGAQGDHVMLFTVQDETEFISQFVTTTGSTGDVWNLRFYAAGRNKQGAGQSGARIQLLQNGSVVQKGFCLAFQSGTSNWERKACIITANSDYDTIRLDMGARYWESGLFAIDNVLLYQEP